VADQLAGQVVDLPGGALTILQPDESSELPDNRVVEWAPLVPYWSVLWRSGVALAGEVAGMDLAGRRVVEIGCGLGVPSLAAARSGAIALATDIDPNALELVERSAGLNDVLVETAPIDWSDPTELIARAPFDLVMAADVLYERPFVAELLAALPRLAPEALLADPGRPAAEAFLEQAAKCWRIESHKRGVVEIHRLRLEAQVA
jgi:predicted nicotinamide N-methyase